MSHFTKFSCIPVVPDKIGNFDGYKQMSDIPKDYDRKICYKKIRQHFNNDRNFDKNMCYKANGEFDGVLMCYLNMLEVDVMLDNEFKIKYKKSFYELRSGKCSRIYMLATLMNAVYFSIQSTMIKNYRRKTAEDSLYIDILGLKFCVIYTVDIERNIGYCVDNFKNIFTSTTYCSLSRASKSKEMILLKDFYYEMVVNSDPEPMNKFLLTRVEDLLPSIIPNYMVIEGFNCDDEDVKSFKKYLSKKFDDLESCLDDAEELDNKVKKLMVDYISDLRNKKKNEDLDINSDKLPIYSNDLNDFYYYLQPFPMSFCEEIKSDLNRYIDSEVDINNISYNAYLYVSQGFKTCCYQILKVFNADIKITNYQLYYLACMCHYYLKCNLNCKNKVNLRHAVFLFRGFSRKLCNKSKLNFFNTMKAEKKRNMSHIRAKYNGTVCLSTIKEFVDEHSKLLYQGRESINFHSNNELSIIYGESASEVFGNSI